MKINKTFEQLLNTPGIKFTIILGSGFHRNAIGSDSILSSWDKLLEKLSPGSELTGQYHLDFEKIIQSKKSTCEDSHKTEERLIECVQKLIKVEQDRVLNECSLCYPLDIFNPEKVSDVISLNFDEVAELLLDKQEKSNLGAYINDSSFAKSKTTEKSITKNSYSYLCTRRREVAFNDKESIRFWHPHGSIANDNKDKKLVLGVHRYSMMLETVIRIRNHHMAEKTSRESGSHSRRRYVSH